MNKELSIILRYINNHKKNIVILVILLIIYLITNKFIDIDNILFLLFYHIAQNKLLMNWSSGVGSFIAAMVALGVAIFNNIKRPPKLRYKRYYDPQYKELAIQVMDISKTADFIELDGIYFSNNPNRILNENYTGIPYKMRRYEWFHKIKGNNVLTIDMPYNDMKLGKTHNLLDQFICGKKKYMIFVFQDNFKNEIQFVPYPKIYIINNDLIFRNDIDHK